MTKVTILSHQTLARQAVKTILQHHHDITVVAEVKMSQSGIRQLSSIQSDVTILTRDPEDVNWFHHIQQLLRIVPASRLVLLVPDKDNVYPSRLFKLGIGAYLTQKQSPKELVHAVRCVASNQHYLSPELATQMANIHFDKTPLHPFAILSNRELEIAYQLANGETVNDIAQRLYLSPGTISCYRNKLLKRLRLKNTVDLTYLAVEHHLIHPICTLPKEEGRA